MCKLKQNVFSDGTIKYIYTVIKYLYETCSEVKLFENQAGDIVNLASNFIKKYYLLGNWDESEKTKKRILS